MILTFEKMVTKNQELRIKYPDNPENLIGSRLVDGVTLGNFGIPVSIHA